MQVSIIIPVYHENNINKIIDSIISNETSIDYEIIVVDIEDQSTIKLIENEEVITTTAPQGRAFQMNKGFKLAGGDYLLFLHADTLLPNNALECIVKTLDAPSPYSAGAFDISIDTDDKILTKISKMASWRSKFFKLPYGDQAIFVKKEVFENIGGYREISLMEDVNFMQKLKRKKQKIQILEEQIITSARRWEKNGVIKTTLTNIALQLLYFAGVHPNTLAKYYYKK